MDTYIPGPLCRYFFCTLSRHLVEDLFSPGFRLMNSDSSVATRRRHALPREALWKKLFLFPIREMWYVIWYVSHIDSDAYSLRMTTYMTYDHLQRHLEKMVFCGPFFVFLPFPFLPTCALVFPRWQQSFKITSYTTEPLIIFNSGLFYNTPIL